MPTITLNQRAKLIIGIALVAIIAAGFYFFNRYSATHPSTNDAYLNANVIRIAAEISGPLQSIEVVNFQHVDQGELLLTIDPRPFQIALEQAEAELGVTDKSMEGATAAAVAARAKVMQQQALLDDVLGMGLIFVPLSSMAYATIAKQNVDAAVGIFNLFRTVGNSAGFPF